MKQRDSIELEAFILLSTARMAIRRKHSEAAERELNTILPELETKFWQAVQQGELPDKATAARVFAEVISE